MSYQRLEAVMKAADADPAWRMQLQTSIETSAASSALSSESYVAV